MNKPPRKTIISNRQAILLILFTNIPTAVFFLPGNAVHIVKQDAWISIILAALYTALTVTAPLVALGGKYPGKTIVQYSENIMGKSLGKIFGLLFIYYFFQVHCWTLREFAEVAEVFLPQTPLVVFSVAMSLVTIYAAICGIEVIGRSAEIIFPLGIIFLVFIGVLSAQKMDISNLLPIMESRVLPLIRSTLTPLAWLTNVFAMGVIFSWIREKSDLKRIGFSGIALSGTLLTVFSIVAILILGPSLLEIRSFSLLTIGELPSIPPFERMESLLIVLWISWIFIRVSLFSYFTVLSLSHLFNLAEYRFLVVPETLFAITYSIYQYDSYNELSYLFNTAQLYYLFFTSGLPLILWLTAQLHKKL